MSASTSVLVIGLDFDWATVNHSDKFDVEKIGASVLHDIEVLNSTAGLEAELLCLNPDKDAVDEAATKFRAGHSGKPWNAVSIGFGVRGLGELTVLFERLVNLAKDELPHAKLVFTGPGADVLEAVRRNFPHLQIAS